MNRRIAHAAQIGALVLALVVVPAALAARSGGGHHGGGGGTSGSSSISLAPLVYDANGDGLPNWGDTVTFNITTTATTQPWVHLRCYQSGTMVAQGWAGYFDGALNGRDFGLSSPSWTGGAADCTADLTNPDNTVLASTSFHVYA
jgi:hypothetical protein